MSTNNTATIKEIESRFSIKLDGILWPESITEEKSMGDLDYIFSFLSDLANREKISCLNIIELGVRTFDLAYVIDQMLQKIEREFDGWQFHSRYFACDMWELFKGPRGTDGTAAQIWGSIGSKFRYVMPVQTNAIDNKDVKISKDYILDVIRNDQFARSYKSKNPEKAQLVIVDINHTHADTLACIDKWIDFVDPESGIMLCHDVFSHKGEVDMAINDRFSAWGVADMRSRAGYGICSPKYYAR